MKIAICCFLFIAFGSILHSQNIELSFSAAGDSLTIDSVTVTNLRTNSKVKLPGNQKLLLVDTLVSVASNKDLISELSLFPNPSTGSSNLIFKSLQNQDIKISVFDLAGHAIISKSEKVNAQLCNYSISLSNTGIYSISIEANNYNKSIKLFQYKSGLNKIVSNNTESRYISNIDTVNYLPDENIRFVKTYKSDAYTMGFRNGDILLFNCKSGNYQTIITDSIFAAKTIKPEFHTCVDADSNFYPIVKIGKQIWMAHNLNTAHYNNGDSIPYFNDFELWTKQKTGAHAFYLNDRKHVPNYGRLYNWFAVDDKRGICPSGWRVSNSTDWDTLINFLGGAEVAGGKLKAKGTDFWLKPNVGATNSSGFSALPSSGYNLDGVLYNDGHDCFYWLADEKTDHYGYNWYIYYNRNLVMKVFHTKVDGFAVRCIKK